MCEIEDSSLGHQDIYFNKYSDCFGANMDLYITDSLQDMLDIDIKSEMATDLGSGTDLSDTLGVNFSDLPPLLDIEMDNANNWMLGSNSALHSSSFVQNLDLYGSEANAVMVNPNSVMPSMFSESPVKSGMNDSSSDLMLNYVKNESRSNSPVGSPSCGDSHLTFSPNTIKFANVKEEAEPESGMDTYEPGRKISESSNLVFIKRDSVEQVKKDLSNGIDSKPKFSTISTLRVKAPNSDLKLNKTNCSILNNQRLTGPQYITTGQILGSKTIISSSVQILPNRHETYFKFIDNASFSTNRQVVKTVASSLSDNNTKFVTNNKSVSSGEFPKPAYSYSCLIAMALKNSRTGSLPVSEIYNFMCQHFPYFKTAPNGWKNSVRHNLSLNKCFEKIEKPSTNGGQRKGCLWAMNPSKVGKMDEEVQKWSRKDPQAIRKAMVHPDNLEALERGEMKYCSAEEINGGEEECTDDELDVDEMMSGEDPNADVEVIEGYEEIEVEEHNVPFKLEFSLASQFQEADNTAKRAKPAVIHRMNSSPSHSNRRKTPLVNRIA